MHKSFILSTKQSLSIYILLEIFSKIITFYLDIVYWCTWTSISLLINTFLKCFFGCPQTGLTGNNNAKSVDKTACIWAAIIKSNYVRNICVKSIYTRNTFLPKVLMLIELLLGVFLSEVFVVLKTFLLEVLIVLV